MAKLLRKVEGTLAMLRHVPPRQIARRLTLNASRRLAPYRASAFEASPPGLAPRPPMPLLPPRRLLEPAAAGWRLRQPWGEMELSRRIDWRLPGSGMETASWRVNLHYMEFLEGVDDAAFVELVSDWIESNPLREKDAWACAWWSYNLSIRVVVWMQQIARRRPRLPESFVAAAAASLARQLRFLERHLETDLRGNHLMRNIKALLWGGAFFAGPEARRWWRRGGALLERELEWQILADGAHYELSASYHCQVMGDLLEVASLLPEGGRRRMLVATLDRMAQVAVHLTHPDGRVILFNDGGLEMAYAPAPLWAAHAALGGRPPELADGPFALREAGFYGLRHEDEHLVVDCGPIGPDDLIGHGHGDILTFEWSLGGRRMVVDQGTHQYDAGPGRVASRATASHNTLVVDGAEQCDFFGAHRCGRRARPRVLDYRAEAMGFVLEGTHDGFDRLPGRPRHVRRFEAAPGRLVLRDRIESGADHAVSGGLLLHPDCRASLTSGGVDIANGPVRLRVESTAELRLEPAAWFPNLYSARPATRLRLAFPAKAGEQVTTLQRQ